MSEVKDTQGQLWEVFIQTKKGLPFKCEIVNSAKYKYLFDDEVIEAGRVLLCR